MSIEANRGLTLVSFWRLTQREYIQTEFIIIMSIVIDSEELVTNLFYSW